MGRLESLSPALFSPSNAPMNINLLALPNKNNWTFLYNGSVQILLFCCYPKFKGSTGIFRQEKRCCCSLWTATKSTSTNHRKPKHRRPKHRRPKHRRPKHRKPEHRKPEHWKPKHWKPEHRKPEHRKPGHRKPEHKKPDQFRAKENTNTQRYCCILLLK